MSELLNTVDKNIRELSRICSETLAFLRVSNRLPEAVSYQEAVRRFSGLRRIWTEHGVLIAGAGPAILSADPHFAVFLSQLEQDAKDIQMRLEALSSASWPRSTRLGMRSIEVRGTDILSSIIRHLDKERTAVLPLLRRWQTPETWTAGNTPLENPPVEQRVSA